jgi:flagellar export protein FliJ
VRRFEFSLDRLLKVKRQLEKLAVLEQARAQDAADRARATLQDLHDQLARVAEHVGASVGRAVTPTQWAAASDMTERLGQSIQAAEQEVVAADQRLETASQERTQLATEVEALTTLRQKRWDEWRQEASKADQERLAELTLRRWSADRDEEAGPDEPSS